MARATYANLEGGGRQPDLPEINRIAEYYQIAPADLIAGNIDENRMRVEPFIPSDHEEDVVPTRIEPKADPAKLREVLLYVLEKIGAKPNVGETVLYKLLYFIDFDYYEKYGKSITGLTYVRNHYGPTPSKTFIDVVEGMKQTESLEIVETKFFNNLQRKYLPLKNPDLSKLDAQELAHINKELVRLGGKTARELTELSHKDTPWLVAKQGKPIGYRFVHYRTSLTAVTEPEDEL